MWKSVERLKWCMKKLLGVMNMFIIFIEVIFHRNTYMSIFTKFYLFCMWNLQCACFIIIKLLQSKCNSFQKKFDTIHYSKYILKVDLNYWLWHDTKIDHLNLKNQGYS